MQRCAIRVTYSANRTRGQWAAHGRYIARESAIHSDAGISRAFGPTGAVPDIHTILGEWQKAGDPRMFKLIISPEFGERVDLKRLTQQLVSKMEEDLAMRLEWVATIHSNTEHPHVHVAIRGVARGGKPLFLPRGYVQHGIRQEAEELVTAQLGRRSTADIQESHRRATHQLRYTPLDQIINCMNETRADSALTSVPFVFDLNKVTSSIEPHYLKIRLLFLEKMGLAEPRSSNQWSVHSDLQTVLRAMGEAKDRQRTLAAHRTVLSDTRLPVRVTDPATLEQLLVPARKGTNTIGLGRSQGASV
jgi:type IV secretory pathway VirD2 relaxase